VFVLIDDIPNQLGTGEMESLDVNGVEIYEMLRRIWRKIQIRSVATIISSMATMRIGATMTVTTITI